MIVNGRLVFSVEFYVADLECDDVYDSFDNIIDAWEAGECELTDVSFDEYASDYEDDEEDDD